MNGKHTIEDIENSEKMEDIWKRVGIQTFGTIDERVNLMLSDREKCKERGYHRVDREPENSDEPMVCYDCELFFSKDYAESCGTKYKVDP